MNAHLYQALSLLEAAEFAGLAIVAALRWHRRRSAPGAWLAATFVTLGSVLVIAQFFAQGGSRPPAWFVKALLVLIVAFPYLLFRFMQSFGGAPKWLRFVAAGLTGFVVVLSVALPRIPKAGDPRTAFLQAYLLLLVLQWALLTGSVALPLAGR
jgi:hypothetical protein